MKEVFRSRYLCETNPLEASSTSWKTGGIRTSKQIENFRSREKLTCSAYKTVAHSYINSSIQLAKVSYLTHQTIKARTVMGRHPHRQLQASVQKRHCAVESNA